jgi:hypothetical protein
MGSPALNGESDGLASGSGNLGGIHQPLIGESDATGAATASAMLTTGGLVSTKGAAGLATPLGQLGGTLQLAGESDGRAVTITSDLSGVVHVVAMQGTSEGIAAESSSTVNRPRMTGESDGQACASASQLTIVPGFVSVDGSAGYGSAEAILGTLPALAGESDGFASTTAKLSIQGMLAGESDGVGSASATAMIAGKALAGSSAGFSLQGTPNDATNFNQLAGHSGAVAAIAGSSAGQAWSQPASLTATGAPSIALTGST